MATLAIALGLVLVTGCGFRGRAAPAEVDAPEIDAPEIDAAPLCVSYVALGTSKYRLVAAPATKWDAAEADCADDEPGATHLVVIGDDVERTVVGDLALADAWVGLDDIAVEGTWVWTTGAIQPLTRPPWKSSEPSAGAADNCALLVSGAELDAKNCDESHAYVCECDGRPARR